MRIRIPPQDVPAIDPATGKFTVDWYDTLKALEKVGLIDLADFDSSTAATNGQVPVFNSTSGKWKPGAN
jgi:hypothetical protein